MTNHRSALAGGLVLRLLRLRESDVGAGNARGGNQKRDGERTKALKHHVNSHTQYYKTTPAGIRWQRSGEPGARQPPARSLRDKKSYSSPESLYSKLVGR